MESSRLLRLFTTHKPANRAKRTDAHANAEAKGNGMAATHYRFAAITTDPNRNDTAKATVATLL